MERSIRRWTSDERLRGARASRRPRRGGDRASTPRGSASRSSSSTACVVSTAASASSPSSCGPRRDADGTLFYDGVSRDITERRRLEDDLLRSMADMRAAHAELEAARHAAELRARTDELTGTFNRRHFSEVTEAALAEHPGSCALRAARRRPLQAGQRRLRPPRRRRRAGRARAAAAAHDRPGGLPGALGRRGVRGAAARRRLRRRAALARRAACAPRSPPRRSRQRASACG